MITGIGTIAFTVQPSHRERALRRPFARRLRIPVAPTLRGSIVVRGVVIARIGIRAVTIPRVPCDWLLVDGSSLIFRAFYGAQRRVRDAEALRTAAIGGFLFRLARLIVERGPARITVADDADWRPQWRVQQLSSYKEHRTAEPVPPGLAPQIPVIAAVLRALGIDLIGVPGYEAEDVIATLAAQISGTVVRQR
jgi:hypothetical protein